MKSKNSLIIIFSIFFLAFSFTSPTSAMASPTITFGTTNSSAIFSRDGYDLHAYSNPAGKITYFLKSGSNIATINPDTGLVIPTSVGQIEVRACAHVAETISATCATKKFTIRPFSRTNIVGEKENIIKTTSKTIYKIANVDIPYELGTTLSVGDFLDESFFKTEAASGVFQITNRTVSSKTETSRLSSSIQKSTSDCIIADIYQYCDAYEVFEAEQISTTTINFEIENTTQENTTEELAPEIEELEPKPLQTSFPATPDTGIQKTENYSNFNIYIIYTFLVFISCICIVYKNRSSML